LNAVLAHDDVVASWRDVAETDRPPLVVLDSLNRFLAQNGISGEVEQVSVLGDGHSNVTLLLRGAERELVLRRPPRPPWQPSAHDVLREAGIISALADTPVPVPRVLARSAGHEVIGAPFYIMERAEGDIVGSRVPSGLSAYADGQAIGSALIHALVAIHGVDWQQIGLGGLAKPTGYIDRQISRFRGLWDLNRTRELEKVEQVGRWLQEHQPQRQETTVIHGDFRPGNALFAPHPTRITAVLDWEMSTLGDPLADIGFLMATWVEAEDPPWMFDLSPATRATGFPSRSQLLAQYVERSGREVANLRFYVTLALWKLIVIMEGNVKRSIKGITDDPFLRSFGAGVVELADRAYRFGPGNADLGI
jgi:aminoglycoside phosphotransferase (APT) family kinase protein